MRQTEFEKQHQLFWEECHEHFDQLINKKQKKQLSAQQRQQITTSMPSNYRCLCQHLAIAKSRRYTPVLVARLNQLVRQGYELLYSNKHQRSGQIIHFIVRDFPQTLRANMRFVMTALLFFLAPALLMGLACYLNDSFLYSLMDAGNIRMMETMYDPELRKLGRERQSDSDLMMFGFYIYNNIGISFKCFASGLMFGLGTLFVLIFNGLNIGGVAGHLTQAGFSETFYPFVIGHGAPELLAIVFSGAAGLKLGHALIAPGPYTRILALQMAAKEAIKIIYGSTLMLLLAAFLEAFWSSSTQLSIFIKLTIGSLLWLIFIYYCFFSGVKRPFYAVK